MSVIPEATGLLTPPSTSSPQTPEMKPFDHDRPSETGFSYFPEPSPRSSLSSDSTEAQRPKTAEHSYTGNYPLPPELRDYPMPVGEIDVAKQLTLEPKKHSLHANLKRAAMDPLDRMAFRPPVPDAETRKRELAEAKRQLLALAGKF